MTLALSIQDLDQKMMYLLMEINVVMFFYIKRCVNFWSRSCIDNARVKHAIKFTPAHPKDFQ